MSLHTLLIDYLDRAHARVTKRDELVPLTPESKNSIEAYFAELRQNATEMFWELTREEQDPPEKGARDQPTP